MNYLPTVLKPRSTSYRVSSYVQECRVLGIRGATSLEVRDSHDGPNPSYTTLLHIRTDCSPYYTGWAFKPIRRPQVCLPGVLSHGILGDMFPGSWDA